MRSWSMAARAVNCQLALGPTDRISNILAKTIPAAEIRSGYVRASRCPRVQMDV